MNTLTVAALGAPIAATLNGTQPATLAPIQQAPETAGQFTLLATAPDCAIHAAATPSSTACTAGVFLPHAQHDGLMLAAGHSPNPSQSLTVPTSLKPLLQALVTGTQSMSRARP